MNPIIDLTFTVAGRISLDLARAQEDPVWEQITRNYDLSDPYQLKVAVDAYVTAYLRNERILSNTPWSCGPSSIYSVTTEVKNG